MIYILDTDVLTIAEISDSPEYLPLHAKILQLELDDRLATTIITYEEQTRGWLSYAAKSRDVRHQIKAYERLKRHLQVYLNFDVLDFDAAAGNEFQRLRASKLRMSAADLKIASIVLARNGTLLTRNLRDFSKVPGLRVEDWTK